MRVVVTGVSGFLGRAVALELAGRGVEVTGVSRTAPHLPEGNGIRFVPLDLCADEAMRSILAEIRPHALVHLATSFLSTVDFSAAARIDRLMWHRLSTVCVRLENLVAASSELVCEQARGGRGHASPAQESYIASKRGIERMALDYQQRTDVPTTLYRFPHLGGATEHVRDRRDTRILNRLLRSALGVDTAPVEIYVPEATELRFLHIQTAAELVADRVRAPASGYSVHEFDTDAAAVVTVGELVRLVGKVTGTPPRVRWRLGAPGATALDCWRLSKTERMVRDMAHWLTLTPAGPARPGVLTG